MYRIFAQFGIGLQVYPSVRDSSAKQKKITNLNLSEYSEGGVFFCVIFNSEENNRRSIFSGPVLSDVRCKKKRFNEHVFLKSHNKKKT